METAVALLYHGSSVLFQHCIRYVVCHVFFHRSRPTQRENVMRRFLRILATGIAVLMISTPAFGQRHGGGRGGGHGGHSSGYRGGYGGGYYGSNYGYGGSNLGGYGLGGIGGLGGLGGIGGLGGNGLGGLGGLGGSGLGGLGGIVGGLGSSGLGGLGGIGRGGYSGGYGGTNRGYGNSSGYYPQNAVPSAVIPDAAAPSGTGTQTVAAPAKITVLVPPGGQVWFDNALTPTKGDHWTYTSASLEPNKDYTVAIKARWGEGDQARSIDIPVHMRAGDNMTVDLTTGH
jgi:uncharacterized protein (TIGR03000 family)